MHCTVFSVDKWVKGGVMSAIFRASSENLYCIALQLFRKLSRNKLDAVFFYESYPLRVNRDQRALFPHAVEMKVQFASTILMPRRMH